MVGCDVSVIALVHSIEDIFTFFDASTEVRKHYQDSGEKPPPMPDNVEDLLPCSLLVTERHESETGKRIGRVRFFRPDYSSLLDQEWNIAGG